MHDEPAAIDLAQDGGSSAAAGGFLGSNQALPAEFIVAGCHALRHSGPGDVVKAEDFVFDQLERHLKSSLRCRFAHKRVLRKDENGILGDTRRDLIPRMRVEVLDVSLESGFSR